MNSLKIAILDLEEKFKYTSCRICLTPDVSTKSNLINKKIIDYVEFCTGIRINQHDLLPTQICKDCLRSLAVAYKFKKLFLLTEKICRNLQKNRILNEHPHTIVNEEVDKNNESQFIPDDIDKDHVDEDDVNEDHIHEDHVNEDHINEDHVNEDHINEDHVNEDHINEDHVDHVNEDHINEDHVNEDHINEDHVNEDHINEYHVNEEQVDGDQNTENYVTDVQAYEILANDDDIIVKCEDEGETYLIYDPNVQVNDTNSMEEQIVSNYEVVADGLQIEPLCGSENWDGVQMSPKRKSIDSNTQEVVKKKLVIGPFNKKKLQRMKPYCKWCDMGFATKQEARVHREVVHRRRTTFVCKVCGKSFIHRAAHYVHARSHLPPMFACEHCDYRTAVKFQMAVHVRIHSDGPRRYQCEQCTASYHTPSNLLTHRRKVHEQLKRFACHVCGKTFYNRTDLNEHLDTHNKIKRFECDICKTQFSLRWSWKYHLLNQHGVKLPPGRRGPRKLNVVVDDAAAVTH